MNMNDTNTLIHFGVLGMKWGIRKDEGSGGSGRSRKVNGFKADDMSIKTKSGITISVSKTPTDSSSKFLARFFKGTRDVVENQATLKLKTKDGRSNGRINLVKTTDQSDGKKKIHIQHVLDDNDYLDQTESPEIHSAMTEASIKALISVGNEHGVDSVSAIVNIAEYGGGKNSNTVKLFKKHGFKDMPGQEWTQDIGYRNFEKKLNKKVKHSALEETNFKEIVYSMMTELGKEIDNNDQLNSVKMSDNSTELLHFGIPGMKWGVRNATSSSKSESSGRNWKKTALSVAGAAAIVYAAPKLRKMAAGPISRAMKNPSIRRNIGKAEQRISEFLKVSGSKAARARRSSVKSLSSARKKFNSLTRKKTTRILQTRRPYMRN